LVERRKERVEKLMILVKAAEHMSSDSLRNQIMTELRTESARDKEYSAMVKSVLLAQGILL
jgi:hypothetical protein